MQDVVATGLKRALTKKCPFINTRAFLYILADLQCRCYISSVFYKYIRVFNQRILKEISKSFSVFSTYSLLNDTRREIIGMIIKN
jgi:hypothetical protein